MKAGNSVKQRSWGRRNIGDGDVFTLVYQRKRQMTTDETTSAKYKVTCHLKIVNRGLTPSNRMQAPTPVGSNARCAI